MDSSRCVRHLYLLKIALSKVSSLSGVEFVQRHEINVLLHEIGVIAL